MQHENENKILPVVGYTPTDTVQMEGQLFRGLVYGKHHSKSFRILAAFFALFVFVFPGIFMLGLAVAFFKESAATSSSFLLVLGGTALFTAASALYLVAGYKVIRHNLSKK